MADLGLFAQIIPAELTGYVRAAQADYEANRFILSQYLPNTRTPDIEFRYVRGGLGLVNAAKYRAWDAESPLHVREGVERVTQQLAPISAKLRQGEYDRLRLQALQSQEPDVVSRVFNDATRLMQGIAGQLELRRGEALDYGLVTVPFNDGTTQVIDYGRSSSHDVTAATPWTDHDNATPLTDLTAWCEVFLDNTGEMPTVMLMSRQRRIDLLANKDIKNALVLGTVPANPSQVSVSDLNSVLAGYDLPDIVTYDVRVNVDGVATRPIRPERLIMLTPDQLGATFWGITASALELPGVDRAVAEGTFESGIVAYATKEFDPVAVWTKADGVAIPALANPDLTLAATIA
ncbi:MAG: major capsid protein [Mycobacterium sp.]|nr:major capsid protein [Mycobacterium sp.]